MVMMMMGIKTQRGITTEARIGGGASGLENIFRCDFLICLEYNSSILFTTEARIGGGASGLENIFRYDFFNMFRI